MEFDSIKKCCWTRDAVLYCIESYVGICHNWIFSTAEEWNGISMGKEKCWINASQYWITTVDTDAYKNPTGNRSVSPIYISIQCNILSCDAQIPFFTFRIPISIPELGWYQAPIWCCDINRCILWTNQLIKLFLHFQLAYLPSAVMQWKLTRLMADKGSILDVKTISRCLLNTVCLLSNNDFNGKHWCHESVYW